MNARAWMGPAALSVLALGLTAAPQQATALDCSANPVTGGKEPSVYRTVEGKKCWYRGTRIIPKAELHWPASASVAAGARSTAAQAQDMKIRDAQALMMPVALPASTNDERHPVAPLNQADTFEARWRGLPR